MAARSLGMAVAVAYVFAATCLGHAQSFAAANVLNIVLPAPEPAEKAAFQQLLTQAGQPMQIGFGRPVPAPFHADVQPFLHWAEGPDGSATAAFTVTSPDARALRLGIDPAGLVQGTELYFYGVASPAQEFGPVALRDVSIAPTGDAPHGLYWSPVIEGETIRVVLRHPGPPGSRNIVVGIPAVSHLLYSPLTDHPKIGEAGSCNIDVRCSDASDAIRSATAKVVFTDAGTTFLCTGTLLNDNDPDSFIPYFLTANHCIDTQSVASTINTFWFFERASCGGDLASVVQRAGGGELLATRTDSDFTFIQLNDEIGSIPGMWFVGWDANPLATPASVVAVHHPGGDLKKWSRGTHTGFANFAGDVNGTGAYERVVWSQGVTEGGSSGGALFDASDRVRGQLKGGSSSCSNPSAPDYYGRFDVSFPFVRQWLNEGATALASGAVITDSVAQGQWKDYKITSIAGGQVNVELFNLSQDADVYVRAGSRPTRTQYDCRPFLSGTASESCTISTPGGGASYIAVRGFAAGVTSFTLRATTTDVSLVAAVLPGSRSVQVNDTATAFATMLAIGPGTGTGCAIAPTNAPAGTVFVYQQTNAANVPIGTPNTPATIPGGSAQSFVIAVTPGQPFAAEDLHFSFDCTNTNPAPDAPGVNTLLLSASATPTPDIVALGATLTNDGIVNIPGAAGTGIFSVASVNVGVSSSIVVTADTGSAALPVTLALCQTNPQSGGCINPAVPGPSATVQINAGETPTFGLFVQGHGNVPFAPAVNRVFVRFRTPGGATVGATSAAVRTQ